MQTLFLQDTMADLHYDMVFDACPLCCCNSNIRSAELGVYIGAPRELLARCDQLQRKQRQLGASGAAAMMLPKQWSGFRIPAAELQKCNCGFRWGKILGVIESFGKKWKTNPRKIFTLAFSWKYKFLEFIWKSRVVTKEKFSKTKVKFLNSTSKLKNLASFKFEN